MSDIYEIILESFRECSYNLSADRAMFLILPFIFTSVTKSNTLEQYHFPYILLSEEFVLQ